MKAKLIKYTRYVILALLSVVLLLFLWVQTGIGLNTIVSRIVSGSGALGEASLDIGSLRGNLFRSLTAKNVNISLEGDTDLVSIERVYVEYSFFKLLRGSIHLRETIIDSTTLHIEQFEDGQWNISKLIPEQEEEEEDTQKSDSNLSIRLDLFHLSPLHATAAAYNKDRDSTYFIQDVDIELRDMVISDKVYLNLNNLSGKIGIPDRSEPVALQARATLNDQLFRLHELALESERSKLTGSGMLPISWEDSLIAETDFDLKADPLSFDDIRIFSPGLAAGHSATLVTEIKGNQQGVRATNVIDLSDGASLLIEADLQKVDGNQFALQFHSGIQQLNPQLFDTAGLPNSTINSQLSANLVASQLSDMDGSMQLSILPSRVASLSIDTSDVSVLWTNGLADIDVHAEIDQTRIALAGSILPFASSPEYDLAGSINELDIAVLADSAYSGIINVQWTLEGEGFSPDEAIADLDLSILPSTFNGVNLSTGYARTSFSKNNALINAQLDTDAGSISSQISARLGETISIDSLETELQNVAVTAFLGDTTKSSINALLKADALLEPDNPSANWSLLLGQTSFGDYTISSGSVNGSFANGLVEIENSTVLEGGTVSLDIEARPLDDPITYKIENGAFSDLAIGRIIQDSTLHTRLNGGFSLMGEGIDIASLRSSGTLYLDRSELNNQTIQQGAFAYSLQNNSLRSEIEIIMPEGELHLAGTVDSLAGYPFAELEKGEFEGIDLGALAGDTTLSSNLTGVIALAGRGNSIENIVLDARLDLFESTLNDIPIDSSYATIAVNDGSGQFDTRLKLGEGYAILNAEATQLDSEPLFAYKTSLSNLDVATLAGIDSVSSNINLMLTGQGKGLNPKTMNLSGILQDLSFSFENALVDTGFVSFELNEGLLSIDSLTINSNVASLNGKGNVAIFDELNSLASDFAMKGTIRSLTPLSPLAGGNILRLSKGDFDLDLSGPPGTLQFDSNVNATGIVYDEYLISSLDLRLSGDFDDQLKPAKASITGRAETLTLSGFDIRRIVYSTTFADDVFNINIDTQIDGDRNVQLGAKVLLEEEEQRIDLTTINLKLDEDQWRLREPASISIGNVIQVDTLHVSVDNATNTPNQYVELAGIVDLENTQNAELTIYNLQIGTLAGLFGFEGLDGVLNAEAMIRGEATSPVLSGSMNMDVIAFGEEAGVLSARAHYDSLRLTLNGGMRHIEGDSLTINGYLPVDLRLSAPEMSTTGTGISQNFEMAGDVNLDIRSDSLSIDWLLPFIDRELVNRLDGALAADFKIRGTAGSPKLSGQGSIVNAVIRSPIVGVTYRDIRSDIAFEDNVIYLSNTSTRTGDGLLTLEGDIRLEDLANAELNIGIQAREFTAINTREYSSTLSGDLSFRGSPIAPILTGSIQLLDTDVLFESSADPELAELSVQLTEEDLLMLERTFGVRPTASDTSTSDIYEAMTIDIEIELERDTWLRSVSNPEMNVQFDGELDFRKEPYSEQEMYGSIEVNPDRSYITQFGKRFEISQGTITFNGPATDPIILFEARYEVPSRRSRDNAVTVFLDIEGTIEQLDLTLRSEPTMELTDMVSYVVTGQPASEALQLGGVSNQSAGDIAVSSGVGLLSGAIESLVQDSGLELDVIQIEPTNDARGATITAGKYVTPRLFTAVSQPIGAANQDGTSTDQGTVVTLELELLDSLLLRLLGGESVMQINLLWHYSY